MRRTIHLERPSVFLETSPRNGLVPSPQQLVLEQEDHRDDHLIQLPLKQRYLFHPDLTFGPIDIKRKGIGESYFGELYHIKNVVRVRANITSLRIRTYQPKINDKAILRSCTVCIKNNITISRIELSMFFIWYLD